MLPAIERSQENLPTNVIAVDFFPGSPLSIFSGPSTIFNPTSDQDSPNKVSILSFGMTCFNWTGNDSEVMLLCSGIPLLPLNIPHLNS